MDDADRPIRPLEYASPRPRARRRPLPDERALRERAGGLLVLSLIFNPLTNVAVVYVIAEVLEVRARFVIGLVSLVLLLALAAIFMGGWVACIRRASGVGHTRNGFFLALAAAVISGLWLALHVY